MRSLNDVTLLDILPPTMRNDPDAVAASQAIAADYWRLHKLAACAMVFGNIDGVAEGWLDEMANDLHVDFYDRQLPVEQKRELVKQSIPMHRRKGTPWAVENLVNIVFGEGCVEEWFEYGGAPYHFRVYSSNQLVTPKDARKFLAALNSVKNLRSVLDEIRILRTWGEVLNKDFQTWGGVLGEHKWGDYLGLICGDLLKLKAWREVYCENSWGNIYSYIWEESV